MLSEIWDFVVVGRGLAGSVLASRLHQQNPKLSILLVEAGADLSNNTVIPYAANTGLLVGSDLDVSSIFLRPLYLRTCSCFEWNDCNSFLSSSALVKRANDLFKWSYLTVPQAGLNSRTINNPAGKGLGGGTAINSCKLPNNLSGLHR